MGRTTKRVKPPFARNATAAAKAKGWNWQRVAKEARLPYPTVRDILAGISPGLEENKLAIAGAIGLKMSEAYADTPHPKPAKPSPAALKELIEAPEDELPLKGLLPVLEEFARVGPRTRAMTLAFLYDDESIAAPYLSSGERRPKTR